MQLKEIIQRTTDFFKGKGIESARLDAELLIGSVLNLDRVGLYLKFDYPLKESELDACRELVKRRAAGEPVAYILGRKDFFKSTFIVNKNVLIPRPETEELVEAALEFAASNGQTNEALRIVDLGTGSGCIGLSLIRELKSARLLAVDISAAAIEVAKQNATALDLNDQTQFLNSDAGDLSQDEAEECLGGLADVVVANPPYIASNDPDVSPQVRTYEPASALFAEENGLREIQRWSHVADKISRSGALVIFEIGMTQGAQAREIFANNPAFTKVEIKKDLSGRDRFVRAIKV